MLADSLAAKLSPVFVITGNPAHKASEVVVWAADFQCNYRAGKLNHKDWTVEYL